MLVLIICIILQPSEAPLAELIFNILYTVMSTEL